MVNKGPYEQGFMVCSECGAEKKKKKSDVLKDVLRPYRSKYVQNQRCSHRNTINVDLGFDFITDMLVLEFYNVKIQPALTRVFMPAGAGCFL